jgi:hypothetical protein
MEYKASYSVTWKKINLGTSHHTVKKIAHDLYLAESFSTPNITVLPFKSFEKSIFKRNNNQLIPQEYEYEIVEKGQRKIGKLKFDWKHKKIKVIQGESHPISILPALAQDKVSENIQLRLHLQQDLQKGKDSYSYIVVERNKIKTYTFNVLGQEKIQTPLGEFDTVKIEHVSDDQKRKTLAWFAKDLHYLMVKVQQYRTNGMMGESTINTFYRLENQAQP